MLNLPSVIMLGGVILSWILSSCSGAVCNDEYCVDEHWLEMSQANDRLEDGDDVEVVEAAAAERGGERELIGRGKHGVSRL